DKLKTAEDILKQRVIGQEEAIAAVANALRRSRAGLSEEEQPIGSFLFIGPTGVGKTELAKSLAEFMFNDEQALVRIDMSEFGEKHSVSRLIGSPPGYVGYDEGGQLTEKIRRKPYSVILFDEIEKAHPEIFNVLLQILDDGHITDAKGRKVNFKNTIIIMTSNLGGELLRQAQLGFSDGGRESHIIDENQMRDKIMDVLQKHFKPEFLNRITEIIIFHPLSEQQIKEIVSIHLEEVRERLLKQDITVEFSDTLVQFLATRGYDPLYGARPLKRTIQTTILNELALKIVDGSVKEGDAVHIDAQHGYVVIVNAKELATAAA
ncbi:MAG: AAA family ATPase, partial [Patescibacteria group bacterium]